MKTLCTFGKIGTGSESAVAAGFFYWLAWRGKRKKRELNLHSFRMHRFALVAILRLPSSYPRLELKNLKKVQKQGEGNQKRQRRAESKRKRRKSHYQSSAPSRGRKRELRFFFFSLETFPFSLTLSFTLSLSSPSLPPRPPPLPEAIIWLSSLRTTATAAARR